MTIDDAPDSAEKAQARRWLTDAVDSAQHGDEAAFSRVYLAVQPPLLRYLRVIADSEAEDVASETWAHVCRDLHTFHGDGEGFLGWVLRIGRNRAIDHVRARGRRPVDLVPDDRLDTVADPVGTEAQALEALATAEAIRLIASLPVDQAEAVMLRTVVGLDAKTAGQILGKRPGAVRAAAHRGLKTLASRLEPQAVR